MKKKKALVISGLIVYGLILAVLTYLGDFYRADTNAVNALVSNEQVRVVETGDAIMFFPLDSETTTGLIFYPGGKVAPQAYAPLIRKVAENGMVAVIAKMPFNLAVLNQDAASNVMAMNEVSMVNNWYIAGHSLGGSMASDYAVKYPHLVKGVILMGAYPNQSPEATGLAYLSITGSEDLIVNRDSFAAAIWPDMTEFETIEGGNHSYFGDYGLQEGDSAGTISRNQQQQMTVLWIDSFVRGTNR